MAAPESPGSQSGAGGNPAGQRRRKRSGPGDICIAASDTRSLQHKDIWNTEDYKKICAQKIYTHVYRYKFWGSTKFFGAKLYAVQHLWSWALQRIWCQWRRVRSASPLTPPRGNDRSLGLHTVLTFLTSARETREEREGEKLIPKALRTVVNTLRERERNIKN